MKSDEKIIISFIFKKNGLEKMKKSDFYLTLSMDMKWMTPEDAKKFTEIEINKDFLKEKRGGIIPSFNINKVEIPLGYKPPKNIMEQIKKVKEDSQKQNIYEQILKRIIDLTNQKEDDIRNEIEIEKNEKNLTSEVSALLILKQYEKNKIEIPEGVEEKIFT